MGCGTRQKPVDHEPSGPVASLRDFPDNRPFLFEPKTPAQAAVLLVHGFTATPWEMRVFGEALAEAGLLAMGICLPGHGTTPEDLEGRRYEEWLDEVASGYQALRARHAHVFGVGMSTGALLLLALAERETFRGLVLLSPFLRLRHRLAPLVGILRFFWRFQKRQLSARLAAHYYHQRPLGGIYQIYRLIRRLRKTLGEIVTPSLILCAEGDPVIDPASAYELFRRLGSYPKEFHQFGPETPHVLTTHENPHWNETVERSLQFFRKLAPMTGAAPEVAEKGP